MHPAGQCPVRVLVVNAGSSSLKLRLLDGGDRLVASWDLGGGSLDAAALSSWVGQAGPIDAVGHRIVHGGTEFTGPVRIEGGVEARLRALTALAPLHQPKSLTALDEVTAVLPGVPAVACFDTAFHAGIPAAAATYALPAEWRQRWGLRRFGFHGLSHAYASRRTAELLGASAATPRIVTCHLGAGASLAAVSGGRCVDTTMGFTPLDGLVMATRSGTVDPGLVLWLQTEAGLGAGQLTDALEHRSGLLGLAGSADMAEVIGRASAGEAIAGLALDVYLHRLVGGVAAMAAALGGIDALTFTGGVGEHAPLIRERAGAGLALLGVAVDPGRNAGGAVDREISPGGAAVRCFVVEAREDLEIARQVREVLDRGAPAASEQIRA